MLKVSKIFQRFEKLASFVIKKKFWNNLKNKKHWKNSTWILNKFSEKDSISNRSKRIKLKAIEIRSNPPMGSAAHLRVPIKPTLINQRVAAIFGKFTTTTMLRWQLLGHFPRSQAN